MATLGVKGSKSSSSLVSVTGIMWRVCWLLDRYDNANRSSHLLIGTPVLSASTAKKHRYLAVLSDDCSTTNYSTVAGSFCMAGTSICYDGGLRSPTGSVSN